MIKIAANVELYNDNISIDNLNTPSTQPIVIITNSWIASNDIFAKFIKKWKQIKYTKIFEQSYRIESIYGIIKIIEINELKSLLAGLTNIRIMITNAAFDELTINDIKFINAHTKQTPQSNHATV